MRVAKEIWEQMYGKMIAEKDFTILGCKKKLHFEVYDGFAYCENYYGNEYTLTFPMVEFVNKSNEIQDRIKEYLGMKEDEPITVFEILQSFNEIYRNGIKLEFDETTKDYKPKKCW